MTGRKYHVSHCPSCACFFKAGAPQCFAGKYPIKVLKGSTAIKCKYYKKLEVK